MKPFASPKASLGDLDAETASTLIVAASDIALVIDSAGVIRDSAIRDDEFASLVEEFATWPGKPFVETVSTESRSKAAALLRDATTRSEPRWRTINHAAPSGARIPILYSAVQIAKDGRIVAFGRDLQAASALQQRLVNAQQSIERDYARLRDAELRYRLLFQTSSEAVVIVDSAKQRVVEANPAARRLFGENVERDIGRALTDRFDSESTEAVLALFHLVRAAGRPDAVHARLKGSQEVLVWATPFRHDGTPMLLVRLSPPHADIADALPKMNAKLLKLVENAPDGFVVTDPAGHILTANAAFLDMAQLARTEQALGQPLDRWLGRSRVDLDVLITNLRQRGSVRLFATQFRGEQDVTTQVEASAVSVMNGGQPCFGFAIRNVEARLRADSVEARLRGDSSRVAPLSRPVEQLADLIGRVSLKDLVREATDMIERLYIEAALEMTGDNRASAAEMLGLSRQSLYVKLRRHGLGDLATEEPN